MWIETKSQEKLKIAVIRALTTLIKTFLVLECGWQCARCCCLNDSEWERSLNLIHTLPEWLFAWMTLHFHPFSIHRFVSARTQKICCKISLLLLKCYKPKISVWLWMWNPPLSCTSDWITDISIATIVVFGIERKLNSSLKESSFTV